MEGTRASGDMNTGSGNCFTMVMLVVTYMWSIGVKFRLANNGDDCVLIVEQADQPKLNTLPAWFKDMGFTMEIEDPVYVLEQVAFCQTQPVWTPNGYKMVRTPKTAIAKDLSSRCNLADKHVCEAWMHAMHTGGLALAGDIPIYRDFYNAYPKITNPRKLDRFAQELKSHTDSGLARLAMNMHSDTKSPIHPRTRYSFWLAFGILPASQLAVERHFQKKTFSWEVPQILTTKSIK